jgi:signal peptide peptidase SppA
MNMFEAMSGGTSCQIVGALIERAAANPDISAIVLDIDSPGGTVAGTEELANIIVRAEQKKPVVAYTCGYMCSAAYWVGSAASKVVCVETAVVGSIGVACVHYDNSAKDAQEGVKRTMITAGRYKRIASDEKPLSDEGLALMQQRVDVMYDAFVAAVAEHRRVAVSAVHPRMADGQDFTGKQALEAGLVDHIGDMDFAITLATQLAGETHNPRQEDIMSVKDAQAKASATQGQELSYAALTVESLSAERPDLVEAISGKANAAGITAGAEKERARVIEILGAKGSADSTLKAVQEGTEASAFYKVVLEEEREGKTKAIEGIGASLGEGVPAAAKESTAPEGGNFMAMVKAYQTEHGCDTRKAMSAVASQNPEAHTAFLAAGRK